MCRCSSICSCLVDWLLEIVGRSRFYDGSQNSYSAEQALLLVPDLTAWPKACRLGVKKGMPFMCVRVTTSAGPEVCLITVRHLSGLKSSG